MYDLRFGEGRTDLLTHYFQRQEPSLGTAESESFNPYAAPLVAPETLDPFQQDDMRIRQQFIGCESNLRSIGGVLILGGLILAIIFGFFSVYFSGGGYSVDLALAALFGFVALLGVGQLIVGIGVGRFNARYRMGAIIFCALWLCFIPFGTIVGGACLWYLLRPAARYVFTPEYRGVIQRTPNVHFQTSAVSWGILITVLVAILAFVAVSALSFGAQSLSDLSNECLHLSSVTSNTAGTSLANFRFPPVARHSPHAAACGCGFTNSQQMAPTK